MHALALDQQTVADMDCEEVMGAEAGRVVEYCVDHVFFADSHLAPDPEHKMSCTDWKLTTLVLRRIVMVGSPTSKTSVESRSGPFRTAKMAS
jgi:hypothetical protein